MSVSAFWKGEVEVKACTEDQGQDYVVRILGKGSFIKESSCSCREDRETWQKTAFVPAVKAGRGYKPEGSVIMPGCCGRRICSQKKGERSKKVRQ